MALRFQKREMQPGDLIFYGDDAGINHVAMYIGNGQIVHASTEATGIKTSPYNYRKPVKIVSVFKLGHSIRSLQIPGASKVPGIFFVKKL